MSQAHPECLRAYEVGREDPEGGLRILDELLSREPAAQGAYNVYGQISMKLGDLVTARDAFELNISASPDDDHRFDWAYLALIIGLQGDEPKARECAARTTIKIQYDFADSVRNAYIGWHQKKGDTASRLSRMKK
jgi:tetratricopeptide (TPR) repeat protein